MVVFPHPVHSVTVTGQASRSSWFAWTRNFPFAPKRPEAHLWQWRRTIGRQVGMATQFLDTEMYRFQ